MRLLDRALSWFGYVPEEEAKVRATSYAGAMANRLTQDWIFAASRSGDQDVRSDHRRITARAREMARNDSNASRFLGLLHQNVIGPHGIRFQSRARAASGDGFDEGVIRKVEAAWKDWARPGNASVDGRSSFNDIERMVVQGEARDGEALIRLVPGFDNPYRFSLQVLDTDLLDVTYERAPSRNQNEIRMGVEIDGWNRPVAYWLHQGHPNERDGREKSRVRIPADKIIHLYLPSRPGMTRSVTWFAPAMIATRMLGGYREAELVAARISAAKMGFFEPTEDAIVADPNSNAGEPQDYEMDAEPGKFGMTPYGHKFSAWDPQHPTTAYEAFEKAIQRHIAAGFQVSYPSLTGDLSDVNYSSIRAGKLDERDLYRWLQYRLVQHFHSRVFGAWLRWSVTSGALDLTMEEYRRAEAHEWQPRGWDWVDPEKDINAALKARAGGLDSLTRIAASQGRDIEEVFREIAREEELAERYGVELNLDTRQRGPAPSNGSAARAPKVVPVGAGDFVPTNRVKTNGGES